MTFSELVEWLQSLVGQGRLTVRQMDDLVAQRRLFDAERQLIEVEYRGLVVGYCANERLIDETVVGLLDRIVDIYRGRYQVYFEPVGVASLGRELL
jgi:hypothetical protein